MKPRDVILSASEGSMHFPSSTGRDASLTLSMTRRVSHDPVKGDGDCNKGCAVATDHKARRKSLELLRGLAEQETSPKYRSLAVRTIYTL